MLNLFETLRKSEKEKNTKPQTKEWWKNLTELEQQKLNAIENRWDEWNDKNSNKKTELNQKLEQYYKIQDICNEKGVSVPNSIQEKLNLAENEFQGLQEEERLFREKIKVLRENIEARKRIEQKRELEEQKEGKEIDKTKIEKQKRNKDLLFLLDFIENAKQSFGEDQKEHLDSILKQFRRILKKFDVKYISVDKKEIIGPLTSIFKKEKEKDGDLRSTSEKIESIKSRIEKYLEDTFGIQTMKNSEIGTRFDENTMEGTARVKTDNFKLDNTVAKINRTGYRFTEDFHRYYDSNEFQEKIKKEKKLQLDEIQILFKNKKVEEFNKKHQHLEQWEAGINTLHSNLIRPVEVNIYKYEN